MMRGLVFLLLLCSSCMVGPNYHAPMTMMPCNYVETPPIEDASPICREETFEWWKRFGDECLNELLWKTARKNFDLRAAQERICVARSEFMIATANLFPTFSFDSQAARFRSSKNVFGSAANFGRLFQNFFLAGFDVAWELDLFGRLRRTRRAALFFAEAEEENARFTQIAVLSEVAMRYTLIRSLQQKILIAASIVEADQNELNSALCRFESGLAGASEVEGFRAQLFQDQSIVSQYEILLFQGIYGLATLIGEPPEAVVCYFNDVRDIPSAEGMIPVGLPSQLLCRRPDIRAAERELASTNELIGASVANLFPVFTLTSANLFQSRLTSSNFGFATNHFRDLFRHESLTWSFGLASFWPLLDFGKRIGDIAEQKCFNRQALIKYEKSVINALSEVESALSSYFREEARLFALQSEVQANSKTFEYLQDQFQAGLVSSTQVYEAKKTLLISQNLLTESRQALTTYLIASYKALGGEWECFYTP